MTTICIIGLSLVLLSGWGFAVYDIKKKEAPTKPLIAFLALSVASVVPKVLVSATPGKTALEAILASVIAFIFFLACALITNSLGGGDVKFMAVLALTLGFGGLILQLLGTIIATGIYAIIAWIVRKIKKADNHSTIAYIPFLMIGATPAYIAQIIELIIR